MRRKSHATDLSSEEVVKDIRRATRRRAPRSPAVRYDQCQLVLSPCHRQISDDRPKAEVDDCNTRGPVAPELVRFRPPCMRKPGNHELIYFAIYVHSLRLRA